MTDTRPTPQSDHRRKPRKKHIPSARDQEIYIAYRTQGVTQAKLAEDNGLSQRRISQIVQHVERWRANVIPGEANELDYDALKRLDYWTVRARNQALWDRGIRGHDNAKTELTTIRRGELNGKKFEEETIRQVAPSGQFLRIAANANRELSRLSDKPPPPKAEASKERDRSQRLYEAIKLFIELREEAEDEHRVVRGGDGQSAETMVHVMLDVLLGHQLDPHYGMHAGTPLHEMQARFQELRYPGDEQVQSRGTREAGLSKVQSQNDADSTLDVGPGTLDSSPPLVSSRERQDSATAADASNISNLAPAESPQSRPPPQLPPKNPKSRIENPQSKIPPSPAPSPQPPAPSPSLERHRRRAEHLKKVALIRKLWASGKPFMIGLDPADGPIPQPPYRLDGCKWEPSTQSKEEQAEMVKDYLAQLRAQQEANRRANKPYYDSLPPHQRPDWCK